MRPEMALARTAAKGGRYDVPTPSGGRASFTSMDAAHALAGVPGLGARLLLLKYGCGDLEDRRRIAVELAMVTTSIAMAPRYDGAAVRGIDLLCGVVDEALASLVCVRCDGTGRVKHGNQLIDCPPCVGTGRRRWSMQQRAKAAKCDRTTLAKTAWGRIYDEALTILLREEAAALDFMAYRLRNGNGGDEAWERRKANRASPAVKSRGKPLIPR